MKLRRWASLVSLSALLLGALVGAAEAANGNLRYTFKYKNPQTGLDQNLTTGWVYLRSTAKPPPMEKFYSRADHILWGSFGNGTYQVSVPEGTYYVRVTQRKSRTGQGYQLGPPEEGDYTWFQTMPITITADQTLNLGTIYAGLYASSPITITGTVKDVNGVPLAGQYVRAQTERCIEGWEAAPNQCGPVKALALQRTDAQGKYTLELRSPGTYYLYATAKLMAGAPGYYSYPGTAAPGPEAIAPVTVTAGSKVTVDITKWGATADWDGP